MKPFSSSISLRRTVAVAVIAIFVIALIGYGIWRHAYTPKDNYRDMVNAFYTGAIALEVGDQGHALPNLITATQIDPKEAAAWADLGLCYFRLNNLPEATKTLKQAITLAPKNGQIASILGLIEKGQFHFPEAIAAYRQAIENNPKDLTAHYNLAQVLNERGEPGDKAEELRQYQSIYERVPNNLFAASTLAVEAAKAGQSDVARRVLARLAAHPAALSPAVQQALTDVQKAAAGPDIRAAVLPLTIFQNTLQGPTTYVDARIQVAGDDKNPGTPLTYFVTLPTPPATPAAPDTTLKFTPQPLTAPAPGPWAWAQRDAMTANASPALLVANGREVRAGNARLAFPGGPKAAPPSPDGVIVFDMNNDAGPTASYSDDIPLDIACAGAGGLRLYRQDKAGAFTDFTPLAKLPSAVIGHAYTGIWANDLASDGNLDLIVGSATGQPAVLRNNGEGTWTVLHPFGPANSGLTQWAWADLDGDGLPDAAFLNAQGQLNVFENKRSGAFVAWAVPADLGEVAALSAADPDRDGLQDLVLWMADGSIRQLSLRTDGNGWDLAELGHTFAPPADGSARLRWADLDNNGALDLIATSSQASQVLLGDTRGKLVPLPAPLSARTASVDAQAINGRLDIIGLDAQGRALRLVNSGSKNYGWQDVRLRGGSSVGDHRNNAFGIGGEIGLRAGLLYETQVITGLTTHFGLGEYNQANYIRNVWPNGKAQGEFELKGRELTKVMDRSLGGSCPWLFADDGTGASADQGMKFITDLIWRSPLGLRINAQDTAGVVQTRDWVKVRGDQLKPRDGFYNLRITADLWETHFFDEVKLMTVDHPIGTDIAVDERFSIPPPALTVNAMTPPKPVVRAVDDRGQDVTDVLRARDGRYLDTFGRGRYQGVTRDHWVTLDLGANLPAGPLWLVGYGWIHPTDSSINVALSHGRHDLPRDLSLEIPDGKGGWKVAKAHLGFPAGKNKTVLLPLTELFKPGIPHQVRLRTNMEIYWDFLGTAQALPQTPLRMKTLGLSDAALRYRGFSVKQQANSSSPEVPDYAHLDGTSPRWLDLAGFYTRYGDVRALLAQTDDRFVIMNAGDELVMRFPAPPQPPMGWTRDFVVIADGWEKDGNFNTEFSRTVLPLPSHSHPAYNTPPGRLEDDPVYKAHKQDWVTYQTRWVSQRRFRDALRP